MQKQETSEHEIKRQEMDRCKRICDTLKILLWVAIILIVLIILDVVFAGLYRLKH